MSASSYLFDPTIFAAAAYTATALYQAGFMGGQFNHTVSAPSTVTDATIHPPEAIGMRRADAFEQRLCQRPRFTTRNSCYIS